MYTAQESRNQYTEINARLHTAKENKENYYRKYSIERKKEEGGGFDFMLKYLSRSSSTLQSLRCNTCVLCLEACQCFAYQGAYPETPGQYY